MVNFILLQVYLTTIIILFERIPVIDEIIFHYISTDLRRGSGVAPGVLGRFLLVPGEAPGTSQPALGPPGRTRDPRILTRQPT